MRRRSYLFVYSIQSLLVAYVGSFIVWKTIAGYYSERAGFVGYAFTGAGFVEDNGREYMIRRFYLPLIYFDMFILRNQSPAPQPTTELD